MWQPQRGLRRKANCWRLARAVGSKAGRGVSVFDTTKFCTAQVETVEQATRKAPKPSQATICCGSPGKSRILAAAGTDRDPTDSSAVCPGWGGSTLGRGLWFPTTFRLRDSFGEQPSAPVIAYLAHKFSDMGIGDFGRPHQVRPFSKRGIPNSRSCFISLISML